jgi:hypothetical protein
MTALLAFNDFPLLEELGPLTTAAADAFFILAASGVFIWCLFMLTERYHIRQERQRNAARLRGRRARKRDEAFERHIRADAPPRETREV